MKKKIVWMLTTPLLPVTVNLFHMQHLQAASLANSLQSLCDSAKLYDPGQEYSEFVKATNSTEEEKVDGSWTFGMFSDSESTGGSSESRSLDSESISPGDFHRKLPRTPSSGTMSSADDLDEREPPSPSEAGPNSLGTFKKTLMSKAALTHKFRKLRSPTKCRDCEGIVVFQGVECEEGIYRVCGNKIKTEKLCQALENGMHLVDISEFSSHDICDVLKLYLRQPRKLLLPEPFILFRLYKEFIDLAKEIQHVNEEQETKKDNPEDKKWPNMVVDHAEENKMNSKNLGVIFGPSLIRPRPTTAPITISSLAEYSNQARLVEFLITYSQKIFDGSLQPQDVICSTGVVSPQVDQGCFPKPLLSPEERDTEHSMKSPFFSSKEDIHTAESESKIFERATSFEESERKQNALEKCDACLSDKAQLLLDQEVELASQKTEDGKTPKPLSLKSDRSTNNLERRTPRTKIRPISLPIDRLLLASPPNGRNGRNMGNVNLDKFYKNPAFEGVNRKDTATAVCSKFNGFDQQTLQKIQDKQYEQNTVTVKTAVIMPSALQEKGVTTPLQISGDHSVNAIQPSKPCIEPVRSVREVSERRSSDSYPLAPVRAPRTLQPQHWTTFYKPHAPAISVRGNEEKPASPSTAVPSGTAHDPQGLMVKSMPDPDKASACPGQGTGQPKENSEGVGLPDVNPTCQRPRLKRMQQFEDLEDEIPQFV
ncbi:Rho GTPase-activating protein 29 [Saguinus oedipus]|uniref:Rho GTPase-activating protein 29 n=1 Tax=Saguinus oedipus TaxID=9490 RepID=A0ABQ9VEA2_SAGOE|nr:Rho GTPase-activating protein 29 [Saguinus oedipus]